MGIQAITPNRKNAMQIKRTWLENGVLVEEEIDPREFYIRAYCSCGLALATEQENENGRCAFCQILDAPSADA